MEEVDEDDDDDDEGSSSVRNPGPGEAGGGEEAEGVRVRRGNTITENKSDASDLAGSSFPSLPPPPTPKESKFRAPLRPLCSLNLNSSL